MSENYHLIIRYEPRYSNNTADPIIRTLRWNWRHFALQRAAQLADYLHACTLQPRFNTEEAALGATLTYCINQTTGVVQGLNATDDVSTLQYPYAENDQGAFIVDIQRDMTFTFGFLIQNRSAKQPKVRHLGLNPHLHTAQEFANTYNVLKEIDSDDERNFEATIRALETLTQYEKDGHAMKQATCNSILSAKPRRGEKRACGLTDNVM